MYMYMYMYDVPDKAEAPEGERKNSGTRSQRQIRQRRQAGRQAGRQYNVLAEEHR